VSDDGLSDDELKQIIEGDNHSKKKQNQTRNPNDSLSNRAKYDRMMERAMAAWMKRHRSHTVSGSELRKA
jgi:hypothetical protein